MPTLSRSDAQDLCAVPYASPAGARLATRRLRQGGWRVIEQELEPPTVRPDELILFATVTHPDTGDSPGDVLLAPTVPPDARHEPGA